MARKGFLYHIFNKNRKALYVDDNGLIKEADSNLNKANGQPAHLIKSPIGWADTLVKFARNEKYWGFNRDMTVPMKFTDDGLDILDYLFAQQSYETTAYLGISKLDRLTLPYYYAKWYLSQINFVKFTRGKRICTVEALEGGMSKIFKAFENTKYELDVDNDPQVKKVLMDGVALIGRQSWFIAQQDFIADILLYQPLSAPTLNEEGKSSGVIFSDSFNGTSMYDIVDYLTNSSNYFAIADEDNTAPVVINFEGEFTLKLKKARSNKTIRVQWLKSNVAAPGAYDVIDLFNPSTGDPTFTFEGEVKTISLNRSVSLDPGDRLFWYVQLGSGTGTGQPSDFEVPEDGTFFAQYKNRYRSTYVNGLYLYRVFELLVEKMTTGQTMTPTVDNIYYKSDWLKTKKDIIVFGGDNLRGLPGGKIVTSIADMIKTLNHYCVCSGVEKEKLFIEPFLYGFRDDQELIDLGELDKAGYKVADSLLFNSIKSGGPDIDYEDINGRSEFNQTQIWTNKCVGVTKEYDLTGPWRRDPIGMEFVRMSLAGKVTTDDAADTSVFWVNVQTNEEVSGDITFQRLLRPAYTSLTGVEDPESIFNVELSPKTSVLNNMVLFNSILDKQFGTTMVLTSAEKNKELKRTGYSNVEEKADIQIGSVAPQIFKPYIITGVTRVPANVLPLMDEKPFGVINFLVNSVPFKGWLFDGGVKPELNDKQTWMMLCHHSNNMSKFKP